MTQLRVRLTSLLVALFAVGLMPIAASRGADHPQHEHEVLKSSEPVPGESVYQLQANLTDQNGKQTTLGALRGRPALVTMFYASCQSICPVLATTLQRMELELTSEQRERLRVAMISFDPQRDTVQKLKAFGKAHQVDETRWLIARAPESTVRDIAAVLGVRYRPLPDGSFSHSAAIILLGHDGVIRARTESLQELDPQFVDALRSLLKK